MLRKNRSRKDCWLSNLKSTDKKAMSKIASNFYSNPSSSLKIIGITGTNGKTTTTQIINHILKTNKINSGSLGTLGFDTPSGIQSTNFTTPESIELQQILRIMKDYQNNIKIFIVLRIKMLLNNTIILQKEKT